MKTTVDLYEDVGIPCYYCKYAFTSECASKCIDTLLSKMCELAEDMILKGEY